MPFILPPLPRRQFLATSAGLAASLAARGWAADEPAKPSYVALLADTHIAADKAAISRDVNMTKHLTAVVEQIVKSREPQTFAILHGDAAFLKGEAGDYKTLGELLQPLGSAVITTFMLLGNHDDRDQFRAGLKDYSGGSPLETKHSLYLKHFPHAHWFTLDSLDKVNVTPGKLGQEQLAWLAKQLDERPDKPAIISVHHHPVFMGDKIGGITDTKALFEILTPRKQVKAVIFGHTHNWNIVQHEGIHLINLPPVAYPFDKAKPSGWVEARVGPDKLALTLRALHGHKQDGETHELAFRT
jgi:3',5'-cyclic-AMP phosphodiesterase